VTVLNPETDEEMVYPVTARPPALAGTSQLRVAVASPATAATPVGALGVVAGVIEAEAVEASEAPRRFVAVTVKV
jgi:hypothetical protein